MKILIIRKNVLIKFIFLIIIGIIITMFLFLTCYKFNSKETLYPLNPAQNNSYDFNGDGAKDSIQLVEGQNKSDVCIKCSNNEFYLSKEVPDKILFTRNNHLNPKIFIHDLSRNYIPEIILLGSKNSKPITYIYQWDTSKFKLVYQTNKNIFGILDCKNTRTPRCYSLNAANGLNSINSFMAINNSILDVSSDTKSLPSIDQVTNFINLVELPYTLDELPDIFTSNINPDELSLLWNLDKDNKSYAFQNAFFYDYDWNDVSIPTAIKWRLSFEKNVLKGNENDKEELVLLVDLIKDNSSSYKISSIQVSK